MQRQVIEGSSKTERKWKSMEARGLSKFATEHNKTFRRRMRRGIPNKFRWTSWLIITELDRFLKQFKCGCDVPRLFGTPVLPFQDQESRPAFEEFQGRLKRATEEYYKKLIADSHDLSPQEYYAKLSSRQSSYYSLIEIDTSRTFPEINKFDQTMQNQLLAVLNAYANFAPHVGYCQGMNFVCGFIFLVASSSSATFNGQMTGSREYCEHEIFYFLACLMSRYQLHGFFREGFPLLEPFVAEFQATCRNHSPSLMSHFDRENVLSPVYIHQWFLTLFVTSLPPGATVVIWDYVLATNLESIIYITMALLSVLQTFLLRLRFEGIVRFLKSLKNAGNCDEYRIGRMLVKQAEDYIGAAPVRLDVEHVLHELHSSQQLPQVSISLEPPDPTQQGPFSHLTLQADSDDDDEPTSVLSNHPA